MDMDERWVSRTPATMLETFHWFRGEAFDLIIDDLLQISTDTGVIVEGFRLLPSLVKPLLLATNRVIWLLPSAEFRENVIEQRGGFRSGFLAKTSNPERALENLLKRDRMFTDRLRYQIKDLGLSSIEVNPAMDTADVTRAVAEMLGL